jgi:hypothetical protein
MSGMMTVKKAIKIIDWWINQKKSGMVTLQKDWRFSDNSHGIGQTLLDVDTATITNLELIRKELVSNCEHPKKMRDKSPDGKWYCMNCNSDI